MQHLNNQRMKSIYSKLMTICLSDIGQETEFYLLLLQSSSVVLDVLSVIPPSGQLIHSKAPKFGS